MDLVAPRLERYAREHTTPRDAVLAAVEDETATATPFPHMMTGLVETRLLEALVVAGGARRVLEIGTFTGHGALAIAARLPPEGLVITVERDEGLAAIARRHIEASRHAAKIELVVEDARQAAARLDGPFDLVFIDARKSDYPHYYEALLPKLADRGLIVADNVLWSGRVLDPEHDDEETRGVRAFNEQVQADPRVHNALLTVGDGLLMIWRSAEP